MGRPVMRWQILAKDPDRAAKFYATLFGWTVNADNPLGYRAIDTGSTRGIPGGIWPSPPEGHSFVQLFVEVDDVGAHLGRAEALGARVVIPAQKLPDGEEMAVLVDPEGVPFAVFRPAAGARRDKPR